MHRLNTVINNITAIRLLITVIILFFISVILFFITVITLAKKNAVGVAHGVRTEKLLTQVGLAPRMNGQLSGSAHVTHSLLAFVR